MLLRIAWMPLGLHKLSGEGWKKACSPANAPVFPWEMEGMELVH